MGSQNKFNYGWVVVASCTLMLTITFGLVYSYSVFFKPLVEHFDWNRATVSLIYSASVIIRAVISIGIGWLADKYGARKLMICCGAMIGLGFILSSQVQTLGQFILTYALVTSIGFSGAFCIGTAIASRWFTKRRGLAVGIVSTGAGFGTLFIVPLDTHLVNLYQWQHAFIYCGAAAAVLIIGLAFLLRPAPSTPPTAEKSEEITVNSRAAVMSSGASIREALTDSRMILFMVAILFFFFGVQMIMVHLVNYATDPGIGMNPLTAATLMSVIGAVSIGGRLLTGIGSDKIGLQRTLVFTSILLTLSFVILIFMKSVWALYLFTVLFGICYGGEVSLVPLFVGKYWGTKNLATLVGFNSTANNIGGALGPWIAGIIFDATQSYEIAFISGAAAGLGCLILILVLGVKTRTSHKKGVAVITNNPILQTRT
jgi:MFS transporter, OFA family, oxalate/formate antiporter